MRAAPSRAAVALPNRARGGTMNQEKNNRTITRLNAVDRLAAVYQQARLHKRRMHRCASLAIAAGDPAAVSAALLRFRVAVGWEARTRRRYERAVLVEYAWWTDAPAAPAPAAGAAAAHATS